MRIGFRGSTGRRLLLVGLAVIALCLIAVPVALAASARSMVIAGLVHAKYYGGERVLAATVSVPDPMAPSGSPLVTTQAARNGFFITVVPLPLPLYANLTVTATAFGPSNNVPDWSGFFRMSGPAPSFENTDGGAAGVFPELVVMSTRVSGTVRNIATRKVLRGVKVTIAKKSAKTTKKGKFSIARGLWPVTKYKVTFSKSGYRTVSKTFTSISPINPTGTITYTNVYLKKK